MVEAPSRKRLGTPTRLSTGQQVMRQPVSCGPEGSVVDAGRTLEGIHAPLLTGFIAHVMSLQQVDARAARS